MTDQSVYKKEKKEQLIHCDACRGVLAIVEDISVQPMHLQMRLRCPHCGQNWRMRIQKDTAVNVSLISI